MIINDNHTGPPRLDTGCSYAPKCLSCPLALCRYDLPGGLPEAVKLTEQIAAERRRRLQFADVLGQAQFVLAAVAKEHGVAVKEMVGPSRAPHLVLARFDAFRDLRKELDMTLEGIGNITNRHHASVLYGLRRASGLSPADAKAKR